jgi:hypothetical protein
MPLEPRPIGTFTLPDGSKRTVYQDTAGRQLVLDNDNQVVYGNWLPLIGSRPTRIAMPKGG